MSDHNFLIINLFPRSLCAMLYALCCSGTTMTSPLGTFKELNGQSHKSRPDTYERVFVLAIGIKERNQVRIGKEIIKL